MKSMNKEKECKKKFVLFIKSSSDSVCYLFDNKLEAEKHLRDIKKSFNKALRSKSLFYVPNIDGINMEVVDGHWFNPYGIFWIGVQKDD